MIQPTIIFPPVERANKHGLLAVGGILTPDNVFQAHQLGIFPWFSQDDSLLWWSPDPRAVITTNAVHISRRLRKTLRQSTYSLTLDRDFVRVIRACATTHGDSWITTNMQHTYIELHRQNRAHSCEIWTGDTLIAGLYGVCLNRVFCGESMFGYQRDASKIALIGMCRCLYQRGITTMDVQFLTPHLQSMGAYNIPRNQYVQLLDGNPDRLTSNWADNSAISISSLA